MLLMAGEQTLTADVENDGDLAPKASPNSEQVLPGFTATAAVSASDRPKQDGAVVVKRRRRNKKVSNEIFIALVLH